MLQHTHASFSQNLCLNPSRSTVGATQGLMPALDLSSKPLLEVQDLSTEARAVEVHQVKASAGGGHALLTICHPRVTWRR